MPATKFQIKICGIRTVEHALAAVEAGADAIGLNFFGQSVRCVGEADAAKISQVVAGRAARVGVFVNHSIAEIERLAREIPLDWVQLHGDETPDDVAQLRGVPVIRAFRCTAEELGDVEQFCRGCKERDAPLSAVLFDAPTRQGFGGSGTVGDWDAARIWCSAGTDRPLLILAGGLTAENVQQAVEYVRPAAVDTASGVEVERGVKDSARIEQFVKAARAALDAVP